MALDAAVRHRWFSLIHEVLKGINGEPEEEMQVRLQRRAAHARHGCQHVVVVVPVDPEVHEVERVGGHRKACISGHSV